MFTCGHVKPPVKTHASGHVKPPVRRRFHPAPGSRGPRAVSRGPRVSKRRFPTVLMFTIPYVNFFSFSFLSFLFSSREDGALVEEVLSDAITRAQR